MPSKPPIANQGIHRGKSSHQTIVRLTQLYSIGHHVSKCPYNQSSLANRIQTWTVYLLFASLSFLLCWLWLLHLRWLFSCLLFLCYFCSSQVVFRYKNSMSAIMQRVFPFASVHDAWPGILEHNLGWIRKMMILPLEIVSCWLLKSIPF